MRTLEIMHTVAELYGVGYELMNDEPLDEKGASDFAKHVEELFPTKEAVINPMGSMYDIYARRKRE